MKRHIFLIIGCLVLTGVLRAQSFVVPSQMKFANLQLSIDDEARAKIQKKVDEITVNAKYYQVYVERAEIYFPVIEKVFREENLPDDFKYLALLESALVPDAVSRSRAVGFWQLKDTTARELGLQISDNIDERKHLVLASKSVAAYMHKQNYFMRNWLYTLLSYRLGLTGANSIIDRNLIGAEKISINNSTHIYIIHFLAYLSAFRDRVMPPVATPISLIEYNNCKGKKLEEIAKLASLPFERVKQYNSWLKSSVVPEDKEYTVFIPTPLTEVEAMNERLGGTLQTEKVKQRNNIDGVKWGSSDTISPDKSRDKSLNYPILLNKTVKRLNDRNFTFVKANGIDAMIADENDTPADLAKAAGMTKEKFLKYNELTSFDNLKKGQVYYLDEKRTKAEIAFHVMQEDESLWDVSQKYGVRLSSLVGYNRIGKDEIPQTGRVLWLQKKRPKNVPVETREVEHKPKEAIVTGNAEEVHEITPPADTTVPPVEEPIDPNAEYHTVRDGETLFSVSKLYGVTIQELKQWNNLSNNLALEAGQRIRVKGDAAVIKTNDPMVAGDTPVVTPPVDEVGGQTGTTNPADVTQQGTEEQGTGQQDTGQQGNIGIAPPVQEEPSPQPSFKPSKEVTHEVKYGETLYRIAKTYKVSAEDVSAWNNIVPGTVIKPGTKLIIKTQEGAQTGGNTGTTQQVVSADQVVTTGGTATTNTTQQGGTATTGGVTTGGNTTTTTVQPGATHTVQAGESLYAIARKYGVQPRDLMTLNNMDANSKLTVGQQIMISKVAPQSAATAPTDTVTTVPLVHIVKYGENPYGIAKLYNIDPNEFMALNNLTQDSRLDAGQQLLLRREAAPQTGTQTVQPAQQQPTPIPSVHIVRSKESLTSISKLYNIRLEELILLNNLAYDSKLEPGQQIILKQEAVPQMGTTPAGTTPTGAQAGATSTVPPATSPENIHVVRSGDNFYSIAKLYNVNLEEMLALNNLTLDSKIDPGQQIILRREPVTPPPAATVTTPKEIPADGVHTVQQGESLSSIARLYGLTLREVLIFNNMDLNSKLVTGQKVLVQPAVQPAGAAGQQPAIVYGQQPNGDYVAKQGESIHEVAQMFHVPVTEFKKWNNIPAGVDYLMEGQTYIVSYARAPKENVQNPPSAPVGDKVEVETTVYHTVTRGDTLFSIARKYNITVFELKGWNNLVEDSIQDGQRLVVSKPADR